MILNFIFSIVSSMSYGGKKFPFLQKNDFFQCVSQILLKMLSSEMKTDPLESKRRVKLFIFFFMYIYLII